MAARGASRRTRRAMTVAGASAPCSPSGDNGFASATGDGRAVRNGTTIGRRSHWRSQCHPKRARRFPGLTSAARPPHVRPGWLGRDGADAPEGAACERRGEQLGRRSFRGIRSLPLPTAPATRDEGSSAGETPATRPSPERATCKRRRRTSLPRGRPIAVAGRIPATHGRFRPPAQCKPQFFEPAHRISFAKSHLLFSVFSIEVEGPRKKGTQTFARSEQHDTRQDLERLERHDRALASPFRPTGIVRGRKHRCSRAGRQFLQATHFDGVLDEIINRGSSCPGFLRKQNHEHFIEPAGFENWQQGHVVGHAAVHKHRPFNFHLRHHTERQCRTSSADCRDLVRGKSRNRKMPRNPLWSGVWRQEGVRVVLLRAFRNRIVVTILIGIPNHN